MGGWKYSASLKHNQRGKTKDQQILDPNVMQSVKKLNDEVYIRPEAFGMALSYCLVYFQIK